MSQNYYKLYVESIFNLASTIVIKSELSAEMINKFLVLQYGEQEVDPYDPTSWKYYLNVCGQYHPRDEQITITSLDSGVEIVFDKLRLDQNPVTKSSYAYGSRYYRELVTLHPDKELLIIGSLYPADMSKAINAEDGDVISYPSNLVEEQELSLISNIEDWIKRFKARWDNRQFNVSDSLYGAANHGIMYLQLVPLIFNLRLAACKTNEVHSFHIRQYLASHGMLDIYLDQLSLKQALFLYRNIAYIERNNGKKEIFSWLVEKILTDRDIPISEYSMRHNTGNMTSVATPLVGFRRKELNDVYSGYNNETVRIDTKRLLSKEELDAKGNSEYSFYNADRINTQFEYSLSSVVGTKVLESSMIDYSADDPYPLIDIQLNHWLYYSSLGIYRANIIIQEPRTGVEYTLSAFDAYVYWFYIYCKSIGVHLNKTAIFADNVIPDFLATRVVSIPRVSRSDVNQIADLTGVESDVIAEIFYSQAGVITQTSVKDFNNQTLEILKQSNFQQALVSNQQHMVRRAMVKNAINRLYYDIRISTHDTFSSQQTVARTYPEWLSEKNINDYNYSPEECELIYSNLFQKATGGNLYTTQAMGQLQRSMIKLMRQLSSYSVQYITEINQSSIRRLNWGTIRIGDYNARDVRHESLTEYKIIPFNVKGEETDTIKIDCENASVKTITGTIQSNEKRVPITVKPFVTKDTGTLHVHEVRFGTIVINPCFFNDPAFVGGIKHLDSYQEFYNLSPNDQATIKDVYFNPFEQDPNAGKIKLSLVLFKDMIPDFSYTKLPKRNLKAFTNIFIPQKVDSGVRNLLSIELDIFHGNLGQIELPGYILFNGTNVADLFTYFGKTSVLNSFVSNGGEILIDPGAIPDALDMGTTLEIFKGITTPTQLQGFSYSQEATNVNFTFVGESSNVNFVRPFFTTEVAMHPSEPGEIVNAFELLTSTTVLGGFEYNEYQLVGFTINGTQIDFDV